MAANCVSFGYDPNTPACELYSIPIRNQKYTSDAVATKTYANRNCYSCTDSSVYTVHVPEPTPYLPDPFFSQGFGFDPGSLYTGANGNYIVEYEAVYPDDSADANSGFNYFNIVLNPPQDGTWAQVTYFVPIDIVPNTAYTASAAFRPGRDRRASSSALPECQGQFVVTDQYNNAISGDNDFQDLPEGWSTIGTSFDAGDSSSITLLMNIQCRNADYATVWLDTVLVRPSINGRGLPEKKFRLAERTVTLQNSTAQIA